MRQGPTASGPISVSHPIDSQPGPALAGAPAFMPSKPSMLLGVLIPTAPLKTMSKNFFQLIEVEGQCTSTPLPGKII